MRWQLYAWTVFCAASGFAVAWRSKPPVIVEKSVEEQRTSAAKIGQERVLNVTRVYPPRVVTRKTIRLPDGTITAEEREETGPGSEVIKEASRIAAEQSVSEVFREKTVEHLVQPAWGLDVGGGLDPVALARGNRRWTFDVGVYRHLSPHVRLGLGLSRAGGAQYLSARVGVSW